MFGREIPKQRGIYSEILTTEDTENIKVNTRVKNFSLFYFNSLGSVNFWAKQEICLKGQ